MTTSARLAGSTSTSWTYQHDILGNRIGRNSTGYHLYPTYQEWDVLNRMTLFAGASTGAGYAYRADGQRIEKVEGATYVWTTTGPGTSMGNPSGHYDVNYATNQPTTRYFYDGQMGFEDDYNPSGTITKVTRNVLGARGIDRISITENSATTHGYPLYDGHGNCRAILTRDGTDDYATGNWRTYDVWGSVRSGSATGDPKSRYVASIGHVADDESSLIYMRARYYEPATGRFISEDPARHGLNWYVYCGNEPLARVDRSGRAYENVAVAAGLFLLGIASLYLPGLREMSRFPAAATILISGMSFIAAWFFLNPHDERAFSTRHMDFNFRLMMLNCVTVTLALFIATDAFEKPIKGGVAANVVAAIAAYAFILLVFTGLDQVEGFAYESLQ